MNFKEHLIGGAVVALVLTLIMGYTETLMKPPLYHVVGILLCIVYSLIPDIDHPNSKIRKYTSVVLLVVSIISILGVIEGTVIPELVSKLVGVSSALILLSLWFIKHRGIMHSPVIGLLLSLPAFVLGWQGFVYAYLGFLTHLVLDWKKE